MLLISVVLPRQQVTYLSLRGDLKPWCVEYWGHGGELNIFSEPS